MYNLRMTDLRFPIGEFVMPMPVTPKLRADAIASIAELPVKMRDAVRGLSEAQLDTPYRPGGWTLRQVVHHVPDSHLNAYVRVKLALTEDNPTIKPVPTRMRSRGCRTRGCRSMCRCRSSIRCTRDGWSC